MGRGPHRRPQRLAAKLQAIRTYLGLTPVEMLRRLGYGESSITPGHITEYEKGTRLPPMQVVLQYARLVGGVTMEMLVDDEMELPVDLGLQTRLIEVRKEANFELAKLDGIEKWLAEISKEDLPEDVLDQINEVERILNIISRRYPK